MSKLVIVESPTKAKKLQTYLGSDYIVESSAGHIRDLPTNSQSVPEKYKGQEWAKLGVDVENDFTPLYVVSPEKKARIADLKRHLKQVDELLLATDQDREGEAISWHLLEVLNPKVPVRRMVFNEISKGAILEALENTRELDVQLVQAQEARRIIDRLYGYEISRILWKKIRGQLSAGRVQSVALRMVVEREQARMRFCKVDYWDLSATLKTAQGATFDARLRSIDDVRLASGKDFDPDSGTLKKSDLVHLDEAGARALADALNDVPYRIESVEEKPRTINPAPPFTTSTMQQEGNRKLSFDARRTMRAAQHLYEEGLITYMRTDSTYLSPPALTQMREEIVNLYGADELPEQPNVYKTKVKNAQEAHEAIRPAGDRLLTIDEVRSKLGTTKTDSVRLYELIWKRTIACQMKPAKGRRMTVRIDATAKDQRKASFVATGQTIDFPGFMRAYVEGSDDPESELATKDKLLPPVVTGESVTADALEASGHTTQPPARLTEATLVKELEASGIGRPSTYATIISKIQERRYVFKKGAALVPEFTAFAVIALMLDHLGHLLQYDFTAQMEDRLDEISCGNEERLPYLREFYFGNGKQGLRSFISGEYVDSIDPSQVCRVTLAGAKPEDAIVVRVMRKGAFIADEGGGEDARWAPVPEHQCPDLLTIEFARELLEAQAATDVPIGTHPETGENVYIKRGQYGPYVQLGEPPEKGSKAPKPKRVKLLPSMLEGWQSLDLETALQLLSLPRLLGLDAEGKEIHACTGRYGPYIKRDKDTRSLQDSDDLLTIGLDRALALLAVEKRGRRAREPIHTFTNVEALGGEDIKLLEGRYGPYITDGSVNASLPRDFGDPMTLTLEQAVELIERKRQAAPKKKKKATKKKATKKKATKKKATKKKATKKKATKKKATKKKATKKKASETD